MIVFTRLIVLVIRSTNIVHTCNKQLVPRGLEDKPSGSDHMTQAPSRALWSLHYTLVLIRHYLDCQWCSRTRTAAAFWYFELRHLVSDMSIILLTICADERLKFAPKVSIVFSSPIQPERQALPHPFSLLMNFWRDTRAFLSSVYTRFGSTSCLRNHRFGSITLYILIAVAGSISSGSSRRLRGMFGISTLLILFSFRMTLTMARMPRNPDDTLRNPSVRHL